MSNRWHRLGFVLLLPFGSAACTSQASNEQTSADGGVPTSVDSGVQTSADGGVPPSEVADASPPLAACETKITKARTGVLERARAPRTACTDAEVAGLLSGSSMGPPISSTCLQCASPSDEWDKSEKPMGCLVAKGEAAACVQAAGNYIVCLEDACEQCIKASESSTCVSSANKGQCAALSKRDPSCSGSYAQNLQFCASESASLAFMCGGKADVGTCSPLEEQGALVTPTTGSGVPSFAGGTIVDGTYLLTKLEGFGTAASSVSGKVRRETLAVAGTKVTDVSVASGIVKSSAGNRAVAGSDLTLTNTCPSSQVVPYRFTATATSLVLGFGFGVGSEGDGVVATYTKK